MTRYCHFTDGEIAVACNLRASFWSLGAIAMALGKKRRTVGRLFSTMRQRNDARIMRADFIHDLARADGDVRFISLANVEEIIKSPGFRAGLKRKVAA